VTEPEETSALEKNWIHLVKISAIPKFRRILPKVQSRDGPEPEVNYWQAAAPSNSALEPRFARDPESPPWFTLDARSSMQKVLGFV
jgi:hypothetical protein